MTHQQSNHLEDLIFKKIVEKYQAALCQQEAEGTGIIYTKAFEVVQRARDKAEELGVPVVISLLDSSAQTVLHYRMEDALLVSNELADKKAYSALGMKMQTKDLGKLTKSDRWLFQLETMTDGKIVSLAGGIPILSKERIIGAIGVSGGTASEDQQIAEYAIKGITDNR